MAQFGERVLALPGDEGGDASSADVLVYVIPALGVLLAAGGIGSPRCAGAARRRSGSAARGRARRRGEQLASGRRPRPLRPVIAPGRRRRHVDGRLRGGLHLVRLPLRAAARARLPVDDLAACRSPTSRRGSGAGRCSGRRVLFCLVVHGDVRRARDDRHRARADASGPPRSFCARSPGVVIALLGVLFIAMLFVPMLNASGARSSSCAAPTPAARSWPGWRSRSPGCPAPGRRWARS